ncbi:type VI secretion system-associated protein TagF [Chitinimonas lacunae]|uniref:Type VI secretion system-associated protein TagF n=1 Tax=Chitinimonas lacunae TaxID=1963018 RepID=A0ABV8MTW6_9NEIS
MHDLPVAGWYGKIPALSDFASRRLDPAFVSGWDSWLRASLLASRERLGQSWLERYLTARVWRFLITPGVLGPHAAMGVMMPSVDGVGRYYPFAICAQLSTPWVSRLTRADSLAWFDQIESVALAALAKNLSPELIDEALARIPVPRGLPDDSQLDDSVARLVDGWHLRPDSTGMVRLNGGRTLNDALLCLGRANFSRLVEGKTLWWTGASEGIPPMLVRYDSMPPPHSFAHFLQPGS